MGHDTKFYGIVPYGTGGYALIKGAILDTVEWINGEGFREKAKNGRLQYLCVCHVEQSAVFDVVSAGGIGKEVKTSLYLTSIWYSVTEKKNYAMVMDFNAMRVAGNLMLDVSAGGPVGYNTGMLASSPYEPWHGEIEIVRNGVGGEVAVAESEGKGEL